MFKVKFEEEMNNLKKKEFGSYQHYIFKNNKLTSDEKILLIDLMNNTSNFNNNISGITYFMNLLDCSKKTIGRIFKNLEKNKYIVRKRYFVNTPTKKTVSEIHLQLHIILSDYKEQLIQLEKLKEENIQQESEFIRIGNTSTEEDINEDSLESDILEDKSPKVEIPTKDTKVSQNQFSEELEVNLDNNLTNEEEYSKYEEDYEYNKVLLKEEIELRLKEKGFTYMQILNMEIEENMDIINRRYPKLFKKENRFKDKVLELVLNNK